MKESFASRKMINPDECVVEYVGNIIETGEYGIERIVGIRLNIVFIRTGEIRQRTISLDKIARRCFGKNALKGVPIIKVIKEGYQE